MSLPKTNDNTTKDDIAALIRLYDPKASFSLKGKEIVYWKGLKKKPTARTLKSFKNDLIKDKKREEIESYIKNLIEEKAISLGFDSFHNIGAYLTEEPNAMKNNAEKLGEWAGNIWGEMYRIKLEIEAGRMVMPTLEEIQAQIPEIIL